MSHGLYATAKATDVVLRKISFFYFDRASNWIPLSDVLCGTSSPPYSSSKLGAELRERQAALPPPKNCRNATSKSSSQENPTSAPAVGPAGREETLSRLSARCMPGPAQLGPALLGSLPARRGLPAAETSRSPGTGRGGELSPHGQRAASPGRAQREQSRGARCGLARLRRAPGPGSGLLRAGGWGGVGPGGAAVPQ